MNSNRILRHLLQAAAVLLAAASTAGAETVQACSYDGSPLTMNASGFRTGHDAGAQSVVADIMRHTGLPQNFDVTEADVPNAAAVILRGRDGLPKRVIAYNRQFMGQVKAATRQNDWAPISIMAHEVGHHLAGHTILPGGSQPPTELEADKFSGFVLFKMGASLSDAVVAMETLVPDRDSPTHPRRTKRVAAIRNGWEEACRQQQGDCGGGSVRVAAAPAVPPPVARPAAVSPPPSAPAAASPAAASPAAATLPAADGTAIPRKFDRFVTDEVGILDPGVGQKLAEALFAHAEQHDVEIVVLVADSLDGRPADDYAYDMMRQLRVGKLEVGNGAVLVVAPRENEVGVALGTGLYAEFRDRVELLKSPLRGFLENYDRCASCAKTWSDSVARACDQIIRDTRSWEWSVRYPTLVAMLEADAAERKAGGPSRPLESATWRKLVRVEGQLVLSPAGDAAQRTVPSKVPPGGRAFELRSPDGKSLVVYADAHAEHLMPADLVDGGTYSMVLRASNLHLLNFDLISFDRR